MIGNIDYMGFYRTNYDELMWKRLIRQLIVDHKVPDDVTFKTNEHFI